MSFDVIIRRVVLIMVVAFATKTSSLLGAGAVLVHLDSDSCSRQHQAVKYIKFCKDCPSPRDEGSTLSALVAKHVPPSFDVSGEIVYSIPNAAESRLFNPFDLKGNIAFVDRGKISLIEKIRRLQQAEASAVIIADTGECDRNFDSCGKRIGSASTGGLGSYDYMDAWSDIKIPVVIVTVDVAEKLRLMMEVKRRRLSTLGHQYVNALDDEEEDEDAEDYFHDEF